MLQGHLLKASYSVVPPASCASPFQHFFLTLFPCTAGKPAAKSSNNFRATNTRQPWSNICVLSPDRSAAAHSYMRQCTGL